MFPALIITEDGEAKKYAELPDARTLALWTYAYYQGKWYWVAGTGKKFHNSSTWEWVEIEKVYVPRKFQMLALVIPC
jgi:hypothetical protein